MRILILDHTLALAVALANLASEVLVVDEAERFGVRDRDPFLGAVDLGPPVWAEPDYSAEPCPAYAPWARRTIAPGRPHQPPSSYG